MTLDPRSNDSPVPARPADGRSGQVRGVQCPTCRAFTPWDGNPHRPFCSVTCRWVDLGRWLDERYRVQAEDPIDDNDPEDLPALDLSSPPAAPARVP